MTSQEIRQQFLDYFRRQNHQIVPSAPVIPQDDPTLLFTNAGMNQFKPYFLGLQKPSSVRIADTQKCIRVSGKHNDLEEVGPSPYHHTFFEMLGNWSFGDYFKREAIVWAWELITEIYKLPKDKLYSTVYETDDEAEKLWLSETDIIPSHVLRFGKKDNFWSMGDTGPCGPCSELHIDRGPEFDSNPNAFVNTGSPRYIELWNLVFIQFDAQPDGTLIELPAKHVDTGAGLERITTVMNGLRSNYDTDLFQPIIRRVVEMTGREYSNGVEGVPHRVIADHLRCLTFAISDGAMPGNEGRGYVLRRLLRRAARFGRKLEMHEPFIYKLVPVLADVMGNTFPELRDRHVHVTRVLQAEEEHFGKTLDRGLEKFAEVVKEIKSQNLPTIPGEEAFRLYDTFGFPLDLMQLMAREEGLSLDEAGFELEMTLQKRRARAAGTFKEGNAPVLSIKQSLVTRFVGYDTLVSEVENPIIGSSANGSVFVATEITPFYTEAGGQVSDVGTLELVRSTSDRRLYRIGGTAKVGETVLHFVDGKIDSLEDRDDLKAVLRVDPAHRIPTQYNHTATHLLQAALRKVLGDHVHQTGSYVHPDYLRFDYTHFEKPSPDELLEIELIVNREIRANWPVTPRTMSLKEAQALGAMALFGEKYGDEVRLIEIGDEGHIVSRELCGGCHVKRTGEIGLFVIRTESSAAAGIRRIEALTGERALNFLLEQRNRISEFTALLVSEGSDPLEKLRHLLEAKKKLEKELEQFRAKSSSDAMRDLAATAKRLGTIKLAVAEVSPGNMDQLREMGDALRENMNSGIGVLTATIDGKPAVAVVVTADLVKSGVDAVPIVKELAKHLQGGGGGKPHLATAGGKLLDGLRDVHRNAEMVIARHIKLN